VAAVVVQQICTAFLVNFGNSRDIYHAQLNINVIFKTYLVKTESLLPINIISLYNNESCFLPAQCKYTYFSSE
jgi:hypothetical protein